MGVKKEDRIEGAKVPCKEGWGLTSSQTPQVGSEGAVGIESVLTLWVLLLTYSRNNL